MSAIKCSTCGHVEAMHTGAAGQCGVQFRKPTIPGARAGAHCGCEKFVHRTPAPKPLKKRFTVSRALALKYDLLVCACGHRPNNHFMDQAGKPCAQCLCTSYDERLRK